MNTSRRKATPLLPWQPGGDSNSSDRGDAAIHLEEAAAGIRTRVLRADGEAALTGLGLNAFQRKTRYDLT